jgi:ankyrin repeat protein
MRLLAITLFSLLAASAATAEEPPKWALMQQAVLFDQDGSRIRSLVADGVNPNDPIGCGTFAPLDGAVSKANVELVGLLLSLGAKPRERQMVYAAYAQDHQAGLKMVELLRSAGVSVNARDYYLQSGKFTTALHAAVWSENLELVRYLLDQPDIRLDERNVDGFTPLMIAFDKGNVAVSNMLLAAGASPTEPTHESASGR